MGEWALLQDAVGRMVRQRRLGTPRFLRCFAQSTSQEGEAVLDTLVEMAERLFDDRPQSMHAFASGEDGHLTAAARWAGGQTALLTAGCIEPEHPPRIDLVLLVSRGALYYSTPADW